MTRRGVASFAAAAIGLAVLTGCVDGGTLVLPPGERIIVFAPHPDDDVIACGGTIQQALKMGDSVWVVYLTSGDASWTSAAWNSGHPFLGPDEYRDLGHARMDEARAGAAELGLKPNQLTFLGYPDQGLAKLWCENWNEPLVSPTTGAAHNPYSPDGSPYSGQALSGELDALLRRLRPDRIYSPHPLDAHSDHWAAAAFVGLAMDLWPDSASPRPSRLWYAPIHGPNLQDQLPAVTLSPSELENKLAALDWHQTQNRVPGSRFEERCLEYETFDSSRVDWSPVVRNAPAARLPGSALVDTLSACPVDSGILVHIVMEAEPWTRLDYRLFIHGVLRQGGTSPRRTAAIDLLADGQPPAVLALLGQDSLAGAVRAEAVARGWDILLPPQWHEGVHAIWFLVEVRWRGMLLNHSGLGRVELGPR